MSDRVTEDAAFRITCCAEQLISLEIMGAPMIEGYPLDNGGEKIDRTMAYVGTRQLFEDAGFTKTADTGSVLNGFPRVLMRLDLAGKARPGPIPTRPDSN